MATCTPTAKALIYVPDFNATAFRDDCKAHGVRITFIKMSYFDYYVFDAVGDDLKNKDWVNELAENCIEVNIY